MVIGNTIQTKQMTNNQHVEIRDLKLRWYESITGKKLRKLMKLLIEIEFFKKYNNNGKINFFVSTEIFISPMKNHHV